MTNYDFGYIGKIPTIGTGRPSIAKRQAYEQALDWVITFMEKQHTLAGGIPRKVRSWCYTFEQAGYISKDDFDALGSQLTEWRRLGYIDYNMMSEDEDREVHNRVDDFDDEDDDANDVIKGAFKQLLTRGAPYARPFNPWQDQDTFIILGSEKSDVVELLASAIPGYIPYFGCGGQTDVHSRVKLLHQCEAAIDEGKDVKILYVGDHDIDGLKICGRWHDNEPIINAKNKELGLLENMRQFEKAAGCEGVVDEIELVRLGVDLDWCQSHGIKLIDKLTSSSGKDQSKNTDIITKEYIQRYGTLKAECNALFAIPQAAKDWIKGIIWQHLDVDVHNSVVRKNNEFQRVVSDKWETVMNTLRDQINIDNIINEIN